MGKKTTNKFTSETNRVYPIKVRLAKPNKFNADKIRVNNIDLYTYKDVDIADIDTLNKLQSVQKYLIIKSEVKESKSEVKEENFEEKEEF